MKLIKSIMLVAIGMSLSACGGGSSSSSQSDTAPLSFKATTETLFNSDENSEPMDLTLNSINADADDDETVFEDMMNQNTIE